MAGDPRSIWVQAAPASPRRVADTCTPYAALTCTHPHQFASLLDTSRGPSYNTNPAQPPLPT